jgi:hypothetical protein
LIGRVDPDKRNLLIVQRKIFVKTAMVFGCCNLGLLHFAGSDRLRKPGMRRLC